MYSRTNTGKESKLTRQGTIISTKVASPPKNVFMQTFKLRQEMLQNLTKTANNSDVEIFPLSNSDAVVGLP